MNELELIIKYKMTDLEAKAYKICLMWQDLCKREFPNEHHVKISKNKDPRKTTIFKYCYKLARETKGLLSGDKEYYLYITAQLQIMKLMTDGEIHALIEPQILVGEKAWKRWKIWKKKYDKKIKSIQTAEDMGIKTSKNKIKIELRKTHDFISKNGKMNEDDFKNWNLSGQISPYYLALSPIAQKIMNENNIKFDRELYRPSITPEIEDFFRKEFSHEFEK
jgi:hypothetical protein